MSKLNDSIAKTAGSLSAIETLLDSYPKLKSFDNLSFGLDGECSLNFLLLLLQVLGVSESKFQNWTAKVLSEHFIEGLEVAVKACILNGIKDMLSCSINPTIPAYMFGEGEEAMQKTFVKISDIDPCSLLDNCPTAGLGSMMYFDTVKPITTTDGEITEKRRPLRPNETWKSCDMNAYLWYVINKGNSNDENNKTFWDNRCKNIRKFKRYGDPLYEAFFEENAVTPEKTKLFPTGSFVVKPETGEGSCKKYRILKCEYQEIGNLRQHNKLKVTLDMERYISHYSLNVSLPDGQNVVNKEITRSKTLFEFDYDYLSSIKLFDTRSLVFNILNSVFNLKYSLNFSLQKQVIENMVEEMVDNIIMQDDTDSEICFFNFSNDKYDEMLQKAELKKKNQFAVDGDVRKLVNVNTDEIVDALNSYNSDAEPGEQIDKIVHILQAAQNAGVNNDSVEAKYKFNFAAKIFHNITKRLITEIILQLFSPKIMLLYAVNNMIINQDENSEDYAATWFDFVSGFKNVITSIAIQVKDMLLQELLDFVIGEIKLLIPKYTQKLALEVLTDYRMLITNLMSSCAGIIGNRGNGTKSIDNVQYADIVPELEIPETSGTC